MVDPNDSFSFAVRVIHIPEANWDTVISARPYYVYSDGKEEIVVYGQVVSSTYNTIANLIGWDVFGISMGIFHKVLRRFFNKNLCE